MPFVVKTRHRHDMLYPTRAMTRANQCAPIAYVGVVAVVVREGVNIEISSCSSAAEILGKFRLDKL